MAERKGDQQPVQADQRRTLRAPLLVRKVRLEDEREVFFGYSKNLSRGGMFITTVNPLEPGSRVTVDIPLPPPHQDSVRCECEVVWKRPYRSGSPYEPGMGLKFIDLPEAAGEKINAWVLESGQEK